MAIRFLNPASVTGEQFAGSINGVSFDVSTWKETPGSGLESLSIDMQRSTLNTAPELVRFTATLSNYAPAGRPTFNAVYEPLFSEVYYVWTFSTLSGTFQYATQLPSFLNDKTKDHGMNAARVFPEGTHTINCKAYTLSGTLIAEATEEITVKNPSEEYPAANTYYVDPDGIWPDADPSWTLVTVLKPSISAVKDNATGNYRFLVKRGTTQAHVSTEIEGNFGTAKNWLIEAYGTGAHPILDLGAHGNEGFRVHNGSSGDITMSGLHIQGSLDVSDQTSILNDNRNNGIVMQQQCHHLVHDCKLYNMETAIRSKFQTAHEGAIRGIVDCDIRSWRNFGMFVDGNTIGHLILLGNRMAQDDDALTYPEPGKDQGVAHGPFRSDGPASIIISQNDMYSCNGWSAIGGGLYSATQTCIRYNTNGVEGGRVVMVNNVMESSGAVFSMGAENDGVKPEYGHNALVQNNVLIGGGQANGIGGSARGGTTIRGNVMVRAQPLYAASGLSQFTGIGASGEILPYYDMPWHCYNNTFVDLMDGDRTFTGDDNSGVSISYPSGEGPYDEVVIANNLRYAPNYDTPLTGDGPMSVLASITPRFPGPTPLGTAGDIFSVQPRETEYATPAATGQILQPDSGAGADGASTGVWRLPFDITGATSDGSLGAVNAG